MRRRTFAHVAVASALLVIAAVGQANADHGYWPEAGVNPATVAGHATHTTAAADAAAWGTDCTSYSAGDGGLKQLDVYGGLLDRGYGIVVVFAAQNGVPVGGPNGLTYFLGPIDGEFVWADVDGNRHFGNAHEADIQTLIACEHANLQATDTAEGEAKEPEPGPIGPLVLALVVAIGVSLALRVRRPR